VSSEHGQRAWGRSHWGILAITALAAPLLLWALARHPFWSDEAVTAFYARSIVTTGRGLPRAWDGRNLMAYAGGWSLDRNMIATGYPNPLLQFYVAAPFFALMGREHATLAGRLPFALLGLATILLTYALVRRWTSDVAAALTAALLLATNVQYLLFMRQCRYFALGAFLTVLLLWFYLLLDARRTWSWLAFGFCAALLFHTHLLMFVGLAVGLAVAWVACDRSASRLGALLRALPIALALTAPFALHCLRLEEYPGAGKSLSERLRLCGWFLRDMNLCSFFPVLALPLLGWVLVERREGHWQVHRSALFLLLLAAVQVLITGFLSPQPLRPGEIEHADVRYVANLLPICAVLLGFVVARLWRWWPPAAVLVLFLLIGTNLLTLTRPRSFLAKYLGELARGYRTNIAQVMDLMQALVEPDALVLVEPPHQRSPLIFYLGDRYRFCGILAANDQHILPRHRHTLPEYVYSGDVVPDWIVMFGERHRSVRQDISNNLARRGVVFEEYRTQIYYQDISRPELLWHRFRSWPEGPIAPRLCVIFLHRVSRTSKPALPREITPDPSGTGPKN